MNKLRIFLIILATVFLPNVSFAQLDIYQKAEQMIILGFSGSSAKNTDVDEILPQMNVGGVIFFDYDSGQKKYKRNFSNAKDLAGLMMVIKSKSQTPVFIAIDEEGGLVSRLKSFSSYGKTNSAKDIAILKNPRIKEIFSWRAKNIAHYGFNMNFAPVVDLCYKGRIMDKQKRCYSKDPATAFSIANLFAIELKSQKTVPVFKHYPGIGSGIYDTHLKPVDVTNTMTNNDIKPFELLCSSSSFNTVMLSHVVDTKIDTLPASMSIKHIEKLKSLGCSNGLIITDDMDMGAITTNYELKDILKNTINSGVDMIIFSNNITAYNNNKYKDIQNALRSGIDSGEIDKEKIELAYAKIMQYKKMYGIAK